MNRKTRIIIIFILMATSVSGDVSDSFSIDIPASPQIQKYYCYDCPSKVIELNSVWIDRTDGKYQVNILP